jgi:phage shock protein A
MSDNISFDPGNNPSKSFWKKPEGITGLLFLLALVAGGGFLLVSALPALVVLTQNVLYLSLMLLAVAAIGYVVFDPKMRNLVWYMYKSAMRKITSFFVTIDPIGILKNYVDELQKNLGKMRTQIGAIRGQSRKLEALIKKNREEIEQQMQLAKAAKEKGMERQLLLSSRKAARLKDSNEKYASLLKRMDVLYRILNKMHQNSEILLEDTKDQVALKEQERKAIRTSHSAMKSAMSVISGDPDQRAMFDAAMEAVADDVANKLGEMERFMEMSSDFMNSIDLQKGIFEEEGMKMLEKWEKESSLLLLKKENDISVDEGLDLKVLEEEKKHKANPDNLDELFN